MDTTLRIDAVSLLRQRRRRPPAGRRLRRLVLHGLLGVGMALPFGTLRAAPFPDRPVRMVVPFSAGSGGDIAARVVAQRLAEIWKQTVVVDNQVGANGIIGAQAVARAPADGHTLLVINDTVVAVNPALYRKLPYDPVKDFSPIALLGETPLLLVASPSFPAHSLKEFIDLARSKPGGIDFASAGNGSAQHLPMEMLMAASRTKLTHVPFKALSDALTAVVGNQVPVMFAGASASMQFLQNGKLTALAVGSAQRLPQLPDVPTVAESGVPGFQYATWLGVLAPAATPGAIIEKINADIGSILSSTEVSSRLLKLGFVPAQAGSPEQFRKRIADDIVLYGKLIRAAGIEPAN